ncbi:polysaccharide deacetylase family protein [Flavobacterium sp. H122]|uniref:polysaccharide deacetylase family protein n=1 Tax=Flavobacterium sp. H122 TaxID=2529860 RepID=UPI0010AA3407|nr:polysaccharide deacetylase family protein [Flavobacterium sp. H122]
MFYWVKTNRFIKWLYRDQIWSIPNKENKIYLTFDDGPTPEITPWVLDILKENNIKVTFFCIGKNIDQNPEIFKRIIKEGHAIGNHTYNHVNGWKKNTKEYLEDVAFCEKKIHENSGNLKSENGNQESKIFRPPYGKITSSQSRSLRKLGYKIIMWDILTADFDEEISQEKCLKNAVEKIESGSIIVFHDSVKAHKKLSYVLPKAIQYYKEKGYKFEILT